MRRTDNYKLMPNLPNPPETRIIIFQNKIRKGKWRVTEVGRTVFAGFHQTLHSYPQPSERRTSKPRLLPPGPSQIHLANTVMASLQRTLRDRQPQRTDTHSGRPRFPAIFYASPQLSVRREGGLRSRLGSLSRDP